MLGRRAPRSRGSPIRDARLEGRTETCELVSAADEGRRLAEERARRRFVRALRRQTCVAFGACDLAEHALTQRRPLAPSRAYLDVAIVTHPAIGETRYCRTFHRA